MTETNSTVSVTMSVILLDFNGKDNAAEIARPATEALSELQTQVCTLPKADSMLLLNVHTS